MQIPVKQQPNPWTWAQRFEARFLKIRDECREHRFRTTRRAELVLVVVAASLLGNFVVDFAVGLLTEPALDWRAGALLLSLTGLAVVVRLFWWLGRNPLVAPHPTLSFEVGGLDLSQLLPFHTARQTWTWLKEKSTAEPASLARAILNQLIHNFHTGSAFPSQTPKPIDEPHEVPLGPTGTPLAAQFSVIEQLFDVSRVLDQTLSEWYGRTPKLLIHLQIRVKVGATSNGQRMMEDPLLVTYQLQVKTPSRPMSMDFVERFGTDILPQLGTLTAYAIHQVASTDKDGKNKRSPS
jgi:hypothetical protein